MSYETFDSIKRSLYDEQLFTYNLKDQLEIIYESAICPLAFLGGNGLAIILGGNGIDEMNK